MQFRSLSAFASLLSSEAPHTHVETPTETCCQCSPANLSMKLFCSWKATRHHIQVIPFIELYVCTYVLSICKLLLFFFVFFCTVCPYVNCCCFFLHCLSICKLLLFFLHCLSICKLFVVFLHCLSICKLFVVFLHCLSICKLLLLFFFLHCLEHAHKNFTHQGTCAVVMWQ